MVNTMPTWLYIVISIAVAAFVGGLTNHFAIKMLFYPRTAKYIGSWRIPFTPGLIPKRKAEIAKSLGDIVAEYLVTTEGLQEMLDKPSFRNPLKERLSTWVKSAAQDERTLKEIALRYMSEETWENYRAQLTSWAEQMTTHGVQYVWDRYQLADKPLHELVPGWSAEMKERWSEIAAEAVLDAIRKELDSLRGQRILRQLASQLIGQAGGFLGAMASMFIDEEKVVASLTPVLLTQLETEHVKLMVSQMVEQKLEQASASTLQQALNFATGEDGLTWLTDQAKHVLEWKRLIGKLESVQLCAMVRPNEERLLNVIPRVTDQMLSLLKRVIPHILQAVRLPQLVREQVERFPTERLERVILSVSGREFRAITWLGVLLGGIIGLFQAIFMLWLG